MPGVRPRQRRALWHLGRALRAGAPQAEEARGLTALAPSPPTASGSRARSRRRPATGAVTALVLTHPGGPLVAEVLDALADQERLPDRILLTGLDPQGDEAVEALEHPLVERGVPIRVAPLVPASGGAEAPLADVVAHALGLLEDADIGAEDWLWLLHDDSVPEPLALAALLDASLTSSGVGIVGPKLVEVEDPRRLLSVGQTVTRAGRPGPEVRGQVDQGQFDERRDVLGVPVAGMLLRLRVLDEVGGFDPALGDGVEGLDLCWRAHLAGHRVVLAPRAYVRQGERGVIPQRPLVARRRTRQLAVARGSFWWGPVRSVGILLSSLLAALGLLLLKRPRAAAAELADVGAVLSPWRGLAARWRFRGRRRVRRRDLHGLFETSGVALRGTTDVLQDALTPRAAGSRSARGSAEPGPVSEEAQSLGDDRRLRVWSWPLVTTLLVAAVATTVRWRDHWAGLSGSGTGVRGGELWAVEADAAALWHAWWDGWHGPGLGTGAPSEPWLLPLAGLTWLVERLPWVDAGGAPAAVAVSYLLFLAVPAAALSAYLATGTVSRSRWVRAAAAVVWALLPPLGAAVASGRVGPALVHVLAPLLVAGVVSTAGRGQGARRTAACFATVLGAAVLAHLVPGVLLLTTVAGALILVFGPGWGRLRGPVLAVVPWALLGPTVLDLWADPRLLLGGAGATSVQGPGEAWQLLLLHAGGPLSPSLWWTAPLLALAVLGAVRTGARGRRAAVLLLGALIGFAAALGAQLVVAGRVPAGFAEAGAPVSTWVGSYLSVAAAAVVLAGVAAVDRLGAGPGAAWRRPLVTVVGSVAALAAVAAGGWSAWLGLGGSLEVASPLHPAVVTEETSGAEAVRVLELTPAAEALDYRLVGDEPGVWLRDRVRELSPVTSSSSRDRAEAHLADTVRLLAGHQDVVAPDGQDGSALGRLHDLAVGYVELRGPDDAPMASRLDAVPGLTRLGGGGDGVVLWRVAAQGDDPDRLQAAARVRVLDGAGEAVGVVPVDGPHSGLAAAALEPVPDGAVLSVSEGQGWADRARVTLDGRVLEPEDGTWPHRYPLPGEGTLSIDLAPVDRTWHLATAAGAALVAFLALPLGGGRRRRDR